MCDLVPQLRRYLVTDPRAETPARLLEITRQAIEGGVTAVQLRVKGWTDRAALDAARGLRELSDEFGVLFLVNDRVDIALASSADGVHLGVDDLPVAVSRQMLGPDAIIGYSPERDDDRSLAIVEGANYLGVGPVYGTITKGDAGPALGIDRFQQIVRASDVPVIGIGGITADRAPEVVAAGAVGVAVVGDVFLADDPHAAAQRLREAIP